MLEDLSSRRRFLATAAVGTAALAPIALFGTKVMRSATGARDGSITVVPGFGSGSGPGQSAYRVADSAIQVSPEMVSWQRVIGQSFRIAGPGGSVAGTLTSVTGQPAGGIRPSGMRQQPFSLKFELDSGESAATDEIYFVEGGVLAPANLFLQQGATRGILTALLN